MINVDDVLNKYIPTLPQHTWLYRPVSAVLKNLLHEQDLHSFAHDYPSVTGFQFVEQVLNYFDFSTVVNPSQLENIPVTGRVVFIANHPIGSLDGLSLLNLIGKTRPDVKIIANDMLLQIAPLASLLLPVNNMGGRTPKENLSHIHQWLEQEGALIIFPAGEVSRLRPNGIQDTLWHSGFLRIASRAQAPVIPIHITGRNSAVFYGTSMVYKPLSTLLLVQEMFNQAHKAIHVRIGAPIPYRHYHSLCHLPLKTRIKLFRKHLYLIGHDKSGVLPTEIAIAHPENRQTLRQAIFACEALGVSNDGKKIYLYRYQPNSSVMREIGRLRELSFRAVGEGSGQRYDIDGYDKHYLHIVLWDDHELEIVGAYRLCDTATTLQEKGLEGIYTHSLFHYDEGMTPILQQGLELGRSFVQPCYWGLRSLDYLWMGIGAFLAKNPQFRYLFGPVSISNGMPPEAKNLLVYFYQTYFAADHPVARSRRPYELTSDLQKELQQHFNGHDYLQDLTTLKLLLHHFGVQIPTLYKQYSELCEPGGVQFLDFGTDPDFADCIDGLVLIDTTKIKAKKRQRYIDVHHQSDNHALRE
ncbi:MAG: GNAT family N-acyltransferase [Plesiomonas sp.]|uniref:GNAT family N-acyltransferase n=1 Tax=Plesiomonas sp. TaxID=2486279 RepID=UPI003F322D58